MSKGDSLDKAVPWLVSLLTSDLAPLHMRPNTGPAAILYDRQCYCSRQEKKKRLLISPEPLYRRGGSRAGSEGGKEGGREGSSEGEER